MLRSSHPIVFLLVVFALLYAAPSFAKEGYVGSEVCLGCHSAVKAKYEHTIHARVLTPQAGRNELMTRSCEACHGPGQAHVEAGGGRNNGLVAFRSETPEAVAQENAVCLTCHAGGKRIYWEGSPHQSSDVACTTCHTLMESVSPEFQLARPTQTATCAQCHLLPRSQMQHNAHHPVREDKVACGSCHNPHGTLSDSLMIQPTINEECYTCHADKRGPFMWEHAPVDEDCTTCHVPHGTGRPGMLKAGVPRLCQQCHTFSRHPSEPHDPTARFVLGSACLNCHTNIHGSNHPSGTFLTR